MDHLKEFSEEQVRASVIGALPRLRGRGRVTFTYGELSEEIAKTLIPDKKDVAQDWSRSQSQWRFAVL